MCVFGSSSPATPPLPPAPAQAPTAGDADAVRARSDEQARLRSMSNTGTTLLTNPGTINDVGTTGRRTLGG